MQERMSANLRDRSLALQAAESALRYAQDEVLGIAASNWDKKIPTAGDCTGSGVCPPASAPSWHAVPGGTWAATPLAAAPVFRHVPRRCPARNLPRPEGHRVALASVARLERVDGPVKIDRENAERMVLVQANVRGRDLVGFVEEAKARVATDLKLPDGYRTAWGGQFENQQRAAARLAMVVPISLLLIFGLLFATFGSVRQAVLVFANIPFALIGGVFALWISGEYLSVPASVGFIALPGIAVLNGVVMVSYFNQPHARGMPIGEVVVEGARRRLRPVLMTASIAAWGLVPLLFATGPGSEIQRPLAIVGIGGLFTSTVLTLFLLPLLYRRYGVDAAAAAIGETKIETA